MRADETGEGHRRARAQVARVGALLGAWLMSGCGAPQEALQRAVSGATAGGAGATTGGSTGGGMTLGTTGGGAAGVPLVEVHDATTRAQASLTRHFDRFLERDALGFDAGLVGELWADAEGIWTQLMALASAQLDATQIAQAALPLAVMAVVLLSFTLSDRSSAQWAHRLQGRLYVAQVPRLVRLARLAVALVARAAPLGALIVLSYFPVQALFGREPWTRLITDTLWVLLGLRLARGALEGVLGLIVVRLPDRLAAPLWRTLTMWFKVVAWFAFVGVVVRTMGGSAALVAALGFAFKLVVALAPVSAVRMREALLALIPERPSARIYTSMRRGVARRWRALMGTTSALLGMGALGYVHASGFLLWRGWALLALALGATLGMSVLRAAFAQRIARFEPGDAQIELYESTGRLVTVGALLLCTSLALRIMALWDAVLILLKVPLLVVQGVEFSIFNVISATVIVGAAALVSRVVRVLLNTHVYPAFDVDVGVAYAVNTLLGYAIVVIGFFLVLVALGVNLSALTVVLASLSVGIGFGLQTLTENLISGFIILFGRAVRKGDYVTVNDTYGRIEAVGARSVVLRTTDNVDLLIPSKELVGKTITNWTYRDTIVRLHVPVGVSYGADPHQVRDVLLDAATRHPNILQKPSPEVWLTGFGDSSVNFALLVYFDCRQTVADRLKGQLNFVIWDALIDADIEIPFPQRDLHIRSAPGLDPLIGRAVDDWAVRHHKAHAASPPNPLSRQPGEGEPEGGEPEGGASARGGVLDGEPESGEVAAREAEHLDASPRPVPSDEEGGEDGEGKGEDKG